MLSPHEFHLMLFAAKRAYTLGLQNKLFDAELIIHKAVDDYNAAASPIETTGESTDQPLNNDHEQDGA